MRRLLPLLIVCLLLVLGCTSLFDLDAKLFKDPNLEQAVREAIANAVAHRDYSIRANCQLSIFIDRIEIESPGNLHHFKDVEELFSSHLSYSRNFVISDHLYLSLNIERRGSGTGKGQ